MMLKGHNKQGVGHLRVDWRTSVIASFGQRACPNSPSIYLGMHLGGARTSGSVESGERRFSDCRQRVH
jgi:hypothetical protein